MRFWPFKRKKNVFTEELISAVGPSFTVEEASAGYVFDPITYPGGVAEPVVLAVLSWPWINSKSRELIELAVQDLEQTEGVPCQYCPRCQEIKPQTLWSPSKQGVKGMYDKHCTNEHRALRNFEKKLKVDYPELSNGF